MRMMKIAMIILTTTMTNGEGDNIISGLFWRSFGLIVQIHVQPSRIWALPRQSYDRVVCVLVWGESDSNWIPTALKHRIYIELEDVGDNLIGVGRAIFKVVIFFFGFVWTRYYLWCVRFMWCYYTTGVTRNKKLNQGTDVSSKIIGFRNNFIAT